MLQEHLLQNLCRKPPRIWFDRQCITQVAVLNGELFSLPEDVPVVPSSSCACYRESSRQHWTCALRVTGPRPSFGVVPKIAQRIEGPGPFRRSNIHRTTRAEFDPRHKNMDVPVAVFIAVQDGRPTVLLRFETGKCGSLEVIQHETDLVIGGVVLGGPVDNARCVAVHKRQRCRQVPHQPRVTAQDLYASTRPTRMVLRTQQIVHRSLRITCTVIEKFDEHCIARAKRACGSGLALHAQ